MKNRSELAKGIALAQIGERIAYAVVDNGGSDEDTKRILRDKYLCEIIAKIIINKYSKETKVFEIPYCDGTKIISEATDVFYYIDPNFKKFGLNKREKATKKTSVCFVEHYGIADKKFLDGICTNLDDACMTQHQIIAFSKNKGKKDEGKTYAFLTKVNNRLFVVFVRVYSAGLYVSVRRFEYGHEWDSGYIPWVVVPQRALRLKP